LRSELSTLVPELAAHDSSPAAERLHTDRRQRLFDALVAALVHPRRQTLLVLDDLQWCDRETLQFLHYLLRGQAPLLVAATCREEETDDLSPQRELMTGLYALDRVTAIGLRRLTRDETAQIAATLTGRTIAPDAAMALYAESEGPPLFIVETIGAGWTSDRPMVRLPRS
jgi:predicted ATPase